MTPMPQVRLHRPTSTADAVAALATAPGSRPLAGGTDLLVNLRRGLDAPPALVDLSAIPDLDGIAVDEDSGALVLGASVTLARLAADSRVLDGWPVLARAAACVAGPTHREAATVAGNLCQDTRCVFVNQSEWWRAANGFCMKAGGETCHVVPKSDRCHAAYAGDIAPALMVLGASVEVLEPQGSRRLPLADLFRADGRAHLALAPGALVTAVIVPPLDGAVAGYAKVRVRDAIDFPLAGVAALVRRAGDRMTNVRLALTGVAPAPVAVPGLDGLISEPWTEAAAATVTEAVGKVCIPLRTTAASPRYRRAVAIGSAVRLLGDLWAEAETEGSPA
ncbi:4-hydroxybenzoyl-CoA reductase subunit beta [Rhodospira trueperi]|uniref:4-hydroxybenzoyl-CoA reductase subunit beta n=1 Tax=Rhodospira trueperi TaxID=69960 RepID=A0A1G6ZED8_9PROT|nr:4-hydroxybenzoyl-CoA reductase subunit beta [Rhodospira trueperi]SDE00136.1 4-hydroxybenzoyl-CoA reductase subunit beta [Rhodospira trueperi]